MIPWYSQDEKPQGPEVAVIAAFDDGTPFLLPELHAWSEAHGCWMSHTGGLLLKHATYKWAREADVLAVLRP